MTRAGIKNSVIDNQQYVNPAERWIHRWLIRGFIWWFAAWIMPKIGFYYIWLALVPAGLALWSEQIFPQLCRKPLLLWLRNLLLAPLCFFLQSVYITENVAGNLIPFFVLAVMCGAMVRGLEWLFSP